MADIDWTANAERLQRAIPGAETDALIEDLVPAALTWRTPLGLELLSQAFRVADSPVVLVRVAFGLSALAGHDDIETVDLLMEAVQRNRADEFVYPLLLRALGILAQTNSLAYAEIQRILLRIPNTSYPFLLLAATKIIGRLEATQRAPGLRQKLADLGLSSDYRVQAEVLQQQAMLSLADALLADDVQDLAARLRETRLGFLRAEATEERRDDSAALVLILDMLIAFFTLRNDRDQALSRITVSRDQLLAVLSDPSVRYWFGYETHDELLLKTRLRHIADLFTEIVFASAEADEWTNFDAALVELAALYSLLIADQRGELGRFDEALSVVGHTIVLPQLGHLLNRAVNRTRFAKVVKRYVEQYGETPISYALQAMQSAAVAAESFDSLNLPDSVRAAIETEAAKSGELPSFFLQSLIESLSNGEIRVWAANHGFSTERLAVDFPDLLGNDPVVDRLTRSILKDAAFRLHTYPPPLLGRLAQVCVTCVSIVQQIRDDLPLYTLAAAQTRSRENGKGQNADEEDLQKDLFNRLRLAYGRTVGYEVRPIGGGRSDSGLKFSDCEFPIEVKAEYKSIDREHIRQNYLTQPDIYASMRDGIAFLFILDLRSTNAGPAVKQTKQRGGRSHTADDGFHRLYDLEESFWVDSLPQDPQLPTPKQNTVIIALVPGNRVVPSSTTTYSRKPAS